MSELVDATLTTPDWYRKLSPERREGISHRFWAEGRLKLEPWLAPRISKDTITVWPRSRLTGCAKLPRGELTVQLDVGQTLTVDHVILATGYDVNLRQIPYLAHGNILEKLEANNAYPILDEGFQSNILGLYQGATKRPIGVRTDATMNASLMTDPPHLSLHTAGPESPAP